MTKAIAAALLAAFCRAACAQTVNVIYPYEGAKIPPVKNNFIFGNVSPSTASLAINGENVTVHPGGTFIAFLPLGPGNFQYRLELNDGTTVHSFVRNVVVETPAKLSADGPGADETSLLPSSDIALQPGDWVTVSARAGEGAKASFSIRGVAKNIPMAESPGGMYYGAYQLLAEDAAENAEIRFRFEKNGKTARYAAKGRLTALRGRRWEVECSTDTIPLRTDARGYFMFLQPGTRGSADAKIGGLYRIRLNDAESGLVEESKLRFLPEGTPPPHAAMGSIFIKAGNRSSRLNIDLSRNVPYAVDERDGALEVTFYYTAANMQWVVYDSSDAIVRDVRWKQLDPQTARITVNLAEKLWGYDMSWNGSGFSLELRGKPVLSAATARRPLEGLKIMLDPGHSPKYTPPLDGAIGPSGYYEFEANLAIAKQTAQALGLLGANVDLTRYGSEQIPLAERPRIAARAKSDIYISIHNNALPDGVSPLGGDRGFSVYFYHQQGMDLARAVYSSYRKNIPLPDEGLRYGDYHVARLTQMPSILIENVYMVLPEQEAMVMDAGFRDKLARAIAEAVTALFAAPPQREAATAKPRHAAARTVSSDKPRAAAPVAAKEKPRRAKSQAVKAGAAKPAPSRAKSGAAKKFSAGSLRVNAAPKEKTPAPLPARTEERK
ncbi:MAG: N-acetylmuramoyl-L-alanine amidase [Elusimicrobiales bacterium]